MVPRLDIADAGAHPHSARAPQERRRRAAVGGAVRAALSIGPGYEPQPLGDRACFDGRVDGYFVDLRAKTLTEPTAFVSGRGRVYGVTATTRAQRALGWWERFLAGERSALPTFLGDADALLDIAERDGDQVLWRYDVAVPKYGRQPPWYSCMAQGQAASVLVRAYMATGREHYAEGALGAVRPMLGDHQELGLVVPTAEGPIFEECPSDPRSHILNGWVYALWGLWDVAVGLDYSEAMGAFEASAAALCAHVDLYDLGWWSLYSLYPGHRDVATPFYHRIHVTQLDVMYRLTGRSELRSLRERWRSYDRPAHCIHAVAIKALHTVNALRGGDGDG